MNGNGADGRWERLGRWIDKFGAHYMFAGAPYLFGFTGMFGGGVITDLFESSKRLGLIGALKLWSWEWIPVILMIGSGVIAIIAGRSAARQSIAASDQITSLKSEVESYKSDAESFRAGKNVAEEQVQDLRTRLDETTKELTAMHLRRGIGGKTFPESNRVSLYASMDEYFVLAGRHSEHPQHRKPNRIKFPEDQGCIGKAWHGSPCFVRVPEAENNEGFLFEGFHSDYNIPNEKASKLRMKSVVYYALAIQSNDSKRVGVIVFESTDPDGLNIPHIDKILKQKQDLLVELIARTAAVSPFIVLQTQEET